MPREVLEYLQRQMYGGMPPTLFDEQPSDVVAMDWLVHNEIKRATNERAKG